jgi:S-adenosyl-L-methionine hydrolase (adenosine-forming)
MSAPITFLSDYGSADEFAGVCRAVIARIAPEVTVIDLTHGIPRHAVRQGGFVLAGAIPFAPPGVHLAVVDPGVGSERRAVAVRVASEDRLLVGPDNGLLAPAIAGLGGAREAVDLRDSPFRLQRVSATFHGRDLFAPVAARLAAGAALAEAGEPIDPASLTELELPEPLIEPRRIVAHVLHIDGFGNALLDLGAEQLGDTFLRPGELATMQTGETRLTLPFTAGFSDVAAGEPLLYEDSSRFMAIAVNQGSAAATLGLALDDRVTFSHS